MGIGMCGTVQVEGHSKGEWVDGLRAKVKAGLGALVWWERAGKGSPT